MIDEYRFDRERRERHIMEWKRWQVVLGIVGGVTAWAATIVTVTYIVLNHGR